MDDSRGDSLPQDQSPLQSSWIRRLMSTGLRRSMSCSSLEDLESSLPDPAADGVGQVDEEISRSFHRRPLDDQDEEDGDSMLRFLGGGQIGSWSRPLCVSLDRGAFMCRPDLRSAQSPQRIVRGFVAGRSTITGKHSWNVSMDAPLPYSTFQDQQRGNRFQSPVDYHPSGLGSLLTPVIAPFLTDDAVETSATGLIPRQDSAFSDSAARSLPDHEEFLHPESVLLKPVYMEDMVNHGISSEWIGRWYSSNTSYSSNDKLLRLKSFRLPSARAMAIVGKSSQSSTSSLFNSEDTCQSEENSE